MPQKTLFWRQIDDLHSYLALDAVNEAYTYLRQRAGIIPGSSWTVEHPGVVP